MNAVKRRALATGLRTLGTAAAADLLTVRADRLVVHGTTLAPIEVRWLVEALQHVTVGGAQDGAVPHIRYTGLLFGVQVDVISRVPVPQMEDQTDA